MPFPRPQPQSDPGRTDLGGLLPRGLRFSLALAVALVALAGCGDRRPAKLCLDLPPHSGAADAVLTESGIGVSRGPFQRNTGDGAAAGAATPGLELSAWPFEVRRITLDLDSRRGTEVLAINESRLFRGPLAAVPSPIGAVTLGATEEEGSATRLVLEGSVERLLLGAEDLVLHRLCLER